MKSNVGFNTGMEDDGWCTAYAEQARKDVTCSLGVPQEYVLVGMNQTCSDWNVDTIEVQLVLKKKTSCK